MDFASPFSYRTVEKIRCNNSIYLSKNWQYIDNALLDYNIHHVSENKNLAALKKINVIPIRLELKAYS